MGCGAAHQLSNSTEGSAAIVASSTGSSTAKSSAVVPLKGATFASALTIQKPEELLSVLAKAKNQIVVLVPDQRCGDASKGISASGGWIDSIVVMGTAAGPGNSTAKPSERFLDPAGRQLFYTADADREAVVKLAGELGGAFFDLQAKKSTAGNLKECLAGMEVAARKDGASSAVKDVLAAILNLRSQSALGPKEILSSYTMPGMCTFVNNLMHHEPTLASAYVSSLRQSMCEVGSAITETRTAVYRGTKMDPRLISDFSARKGRCFLLNGFLSTTLSKELAIGGAEETLLLEITLVDYDDGFEDGMRAFGAAVEDGVFFPVSLAQNSVSPYEREVLFPPFYPVKIAGVGTELVGGRARQKLELRAPKCVHVTGRVRLDKVHQQAYSSDWKKGYVETMLQLCERKIVTRLSLVDMDFMKEESTFARVMGLVKSGNCAELLVEQAAVADTQIARIIRECKRSLGTLRRLSLNNAELGVYGISLIAQMLADNGMLEVLELVGNDTQPFGAKAIMGALLTNDALTELNMMNTNIQDSDADSIALALGKNKMLAMLNISANQLGTEAMEKIVKALEKNESLLSLNAGYNKFAIDDTDIEESLAKNSTLAFLSFDNENTPTSSELNAMVALNSLLLFQRYKSDPSKFSEKRRRAIEEVLDSDADRTALDLVSVEGGSVNKIASILSLNSTITSLRLMRTEQVFKTLSGLSGNKVLTRLNLSGSKLEREEQLLLTGILTSDTTLTYVNLSGCELEVRTVYFIMLALQVNRTLTRMRLGSNGITDTKDMRGVLGETFGINNTLEMLDLSHNMLGDEEVVPMLKSFCKNTSLTSLKLDLTGISNPSFQALSELLKVNKTLQKLNVSENLVDPPEFKQFCEALAENTTLMHLRLDGNLPDPEIESLVSALKKNKTLSELQFVREERNGTLFERIADENCVAGIKKMKFAKCNGTEQCYKAVARLLGTTTILERLDFNNMEAPDMVFEPVAKMLMGNKTVTTLNFKVGKVSLEFVATLMADVVKANTTISYLNLRWCSIASDWLGGFFHALRFNKGIKTLYVDENAVVDEQCKGDLIETLCMNQVLNTIYVNMELDSRAEVVVKYLSRQYKTLTKVITPDGVNHAAKQRGMSDERWRRYRRNLVIPEIRAVLNNEQKDVLNLTDFYLDIDGMKALAEALKTKEYIKHIEITFSDGGMGDELARAISEVLLVSKSITSLCFGGNGISQVGIKCLANVVRETKNLTDLILMMENIGDTGTKELAEALKVNNTVTCLNLISCNVGDEGMIALVDCLRVNKIISDVVLNGNLIGDVGVTKLLDVIKADKPKYTVALSNNPIGSELLYSLKACPDIRLD
ncbi:MAG: hypothetical protein P4M11_08755 [Candidatus Pacebacteria bacterium]|nr:hypothetical protein [Candidatus Paceibacterota bacterium]